jgi:alpha-ketoglutarate-dependent taurine dioxygenase
VEDGRDVGLRRAGWGWHSDGEDKQIPNAGSLLYAIEVPPEGGDTGFANMYRAYQGCPRRSARGSKAVACGPAGSSCTTSTTRCCRR